MLYFIPAWYQQNQWAENEQKWHVRRMHTEFDDTVKQIQLFHRSGAYRYQIMLLSFAPNFRHFLHRQGVFHAPYWSCFDAIQCVRRRRPMVLSIHNLNWPEGIEFVCSMFVMIAMLHGRKYAQIEFGEDGNPIEIDIYKDEKMNRRNIYDDRGFVSSSVIYEEEKPAYQEYFMESGIWKMRCFAADGHVEINPKCPDYLLVHQKREQKNTFTKMKYDGIEQVLYEVLTAYLRLTGEEDIFCIAMDERHGALLNAALQNRKVILSFFADRYSVRRHPEIIDMVEGAGYVIADSKENLRRIQWEAGGLVKHSTYITPYDSRVDFGISQQLSVQKIMVPVDGMEEEIFKELMGRLGRYLLKNGEARIHLFTRNAAYNRRRQLLEETRKTLGAAGLEEAWAAEETEKGIAENDIDTEEHVPVRFFVEQCVDELAVSKCMREQRIMVDMRKRPELYLQIMAISIGIPQVVVKETEFVEDGGNGRVLENAEELEETLNHYLDGLKNWNEAMVCSYELGKKYTTEKLLEKWKEVIEVIG